ncbi:MAG TPA: hypothetical protein VN809_01905 [Telmatospirillum sp.]|nr:hypothetical protein [Telmatospirillum sp.]
MLRFIFFCVVSLGAVFVSATTKATTLKELQLGIRTTGYMFDPPHGKTEIAILYNPQQPDSDVDARNVQSWLWSEQAMPNVELVPVLVDVNTLDSARSFRIGIVTSGLAPQFDRIFSYSQKHATLTITADLDCVRAGKCAVGVTTSPRMGVFINHTVTNACAIDFLAGFRMMVKEL